MSGMVYTYMKTIAGDDAEQPPAFVIHPNKKGISSVEVTVPIKLNSHQFKAGLVDAEELDQFLTLANRAILKKFPDTSMWNPAPSG